MPLAIALVVAVVVLDQLSKVLLVDLMQAQGGAHIELLPFFDLVMVWNSGVSFGLFSGNPEDTRWILAGVNIVLALVLAVWLARTEGRRTRLGLALVIGGAIGNAIDRFVYGRVADFFDFHVGAWHWPAFNIADTAITVGVVLLLFDSLFGAGEAAKRTRYDN